MPPAGSAAVIRSKRGLRLNQGIRPSAAIRLDPLPAGSKRATAPARADGAQPRSQTRRGCGLSLGGPAGQRQKARQVPPRRLGPPSGWSRRHSQHDQQQACCSVRIGRQGWTVTAPLSLPFFLAVLDGEHGLLPSGTKPCVTRRREQFS